MLAELPPKLGAAREAGDWRQLALLHLAEANACRVVADWLCQRRASAEAATAGEQAGDPVLIARGRILESRAIIGLQDYSRAERLLAEAQSQLERSPLPTLEADVQLGFSSLSHALGKHQLAKRYAEAGLRLLGDGEAPGMRARLQRNRARALAQLGDPETAQAALDAGIRAAQEIDDPKLIAELHLESARLAYQLGDTAQQRAHSNEVLQLASRLSNSQLFGQAHEALGLAALQADKLPEARDSLQRASESFRTLGLARDELRAGRSLIGVMLDLGSSAAQLEGLLRRQFELQEQVALSDRAQAADDFEARLRYAQQQLEIVQLESDARLADERARLLDAQNRLSFWFNGFALLGLVVLTGFFVWQLLAKRRLAQALRDLRRSESRASELLRLSAGMVLLHDLDGRIDLLNPAAARALLVPDDAPALGHLRDHVSASDSDSLERYLVQLRRAGAASEVLQVTPPGGETRLLRIDGRVAPGNSDRPYVIGHAADITADVREAEALRAQTLHDPLTGCFNRRYLEQFAEQAAPGTHWAVINIDLDSFKRINDTHGHEHGDQVLRDVARFLGQRLREGDAVVRVGGDEFVLLPHATETAMRAMVERLQSDIEAAPCRYSLGCALRQRDEPLGETMARADQQMYARRRERRESAR